MIAQRIVVGGVYVSVRRDALLGWRPMVITAPKHATYAQQLADEVAVELRKKFVLKD
jgi:predicted RecB family endonuclease